MKFLTALLFVFGAASVLSGCNPASKDGDGKSVANLPDAVILESQFDWESVDRDSAITVLHKWSQPAEEIPRIAASDASGTRVAFIDKSKKIEDSYALWVVQAPGIEAVEVMGLKHKPESLYIADTGATIFAVASDAGYLYDLAEGKVLTRVEHEKCKAAVGLSADGKFLSTWGGDEGKLFHYSGPYDILTENDHWGSEKPSSPDEIYCADPVNLYPVLGITQIILQTGTLGEPECTMISLNTSQHSYGFRTNLKAYFSKGIRTKDGRFFRCLGGPKENYGGKTESGEIPFTHLATINLQTLSFEMEPLGMIFAKKLLAMNRAGSEAAAHSEDGGIDIFSLKDGKLIRHVPEGELGDYEIVAFAGDLLGALIKSGGELKWLNLRKYEVKGG